MNAPRTELRTLLKGTSRSFYLSLRLLPAATRDTIGLAYLLARATDTIADTCVCPPERRLAHLEALHGALGRTQADAHDAVAAVAAIAHDMSGPTDNAAERTLLERLPALVRSYRRLPPGDRERTGHCLETIISGQRLDLERFMDVHAGAPPRALATDADLEDYCYRVAGVVGRYWTDMHAAHLPQLAALELSRLRPLGVAYGTGLQLLNILRDLPRDLARGRCYLPLSALSPLGLEPEALRSPAAFEHLRPLYLDLLARTRSRLAAGISYTLSLPRGCFRLRLATALPLMIGVRTVTRLEASERPLDPQTVIKIPRREVYAILALGLSRIGSNAALRGAFRRLQRG